ncbi:MAG: hypothetical protein L0H93_07965 [Nocardioides sp.]|nr:hypothetical protein [Nocardioides sp.]
MADFLREVVDEHEIPVPDLTPPPQVATSDREEPSSVVPPPTRATTWHTAHRRHQKVKYAYGDLITDPLKALDYSALFDVSEPHTEKFLLAFDECEEVASSGPGTPDDQELVDRYAHATRRLQLLWDAAYAYAERTGSEWLPHGEQDTVRKAKSLLRTAHDKTGATDAERTRAAEKARELLATIRSFRMPDEARQAIEHTARKRLT